MNILWIVNVVFPEAEQLLSGKSMPNYSGGWMMSLANLISSIPDNNLFVVSVSNSVQELTVLKGSLITYYLMPYGKGNIKYNKEYEAYFRKIKDNVNPDIIHIHGTEFTHGLSYVKACGNENVVVSLQGIKSGIAKYYLGGLSLKDRLINCTLRDLLKGGIGREQRLYEETGLLEQELIKSVHHIIGRTEWDHAQVVSINADAAYHFCNEILRKEFYSGPTWNYNSCNKHTIFLSQAWYPLKGAHQVFKALPFILKSYPDACVRVAGTDITSYKGIEKLKHETTYGSYLRNLIDNLGIRNNVKFLGLLSATEMKNEYLSCNVFVCPSSIENSPNSLGEAQLLGVPVVASYVGGTPDFMRGNEEKLYRFEETAMLAEKICRVFADKDSQRDMKPIANERHSPSINGERMVQIYKEISR